MPGPFLLGWVRDFRFDGILGLVVHNRGYEDREMALRILHLATNYLPITGGIERFIQELSLGCRGGGACAFGVVL